MYMYMIKQHGKLDSLQIFLKIHVSQSPVLYQRHGRLFVHTFIA